MNRPVCLHLPDDLVARLDAVAAEDDRSRSSVVRKIVERHLREHAAMQLPAAIGRPQRSEPDTAAGDSVEAHLRRHSRLSQKVIREGFPMTERE